MRLLSTLGLVTGLRNPHLSPHKMVGFSGMLRNIVRQKAPVPRGFLATYGQTETFWDEIWRSGRDHDSTENYPL
jgi:hypothetical protein